jgi:hypothetical protein
MAQQQTLWDHFAQRGAEATPQDEADRDRTRRRSIKQLRAGGHWLTLLRVARTVPQPFTLNDLSVAAWRAHPELFGMKGYPFPDNHRIHYILYGTRGLIAKGIVRRVREGLFRLPDGPGAEEPAGPPPQPEAES